jgi:hypothetical protein
MFTRFEQTDEPPLVSSVREGNDVSSQKNQKAPLQPDQTFHE